MNRVIRILMEWDGDTKEEAEERLQEVRQLVEESRYDYECVEQIIMEELGLEMDYITDIIL